MIETMGMSLLATGGLQKYRWFAPSFSWLGPFAVERDYVAKLLAQSISNRIASSL